MFLKILKLCLLLAIVVSFALGCFSIRPFTKLLKPWIVFDQWARVNVPDKQNEVCIKTLRQNGGKFWTAPMKDEHINMGCMMDTTIVASVLSIKLTNIAYPPQQDRVALDCEFAVKLNKFILNNMTLLAKSYLGSSPKIFLHKGGYSCRNQTKNFSIKSEHAYGQAIDFAGLILEDGRKILLDDQIKSDSVRDFFDALELEACSYFGTNLGPSYDELHKDHLHWSTGFPRVCSF